MFRIPDPVWRRRIKKERLEITESLGFMSKEHHTIRNYTVRELPEVGRPLPLESISSGTGISERRTLPILDELEKALTFLYRNDSGEVSWAYPVTSVNTPHLVKSTDGDWKTFAA